MPSVTKLAATFVTTGLGHFASCSASAIRRRSGRIGLNCPGKGAALHCFMHRSVNKSTESMAMNQVRVISFQVKVHTHANICRMFAILWTHSVLFARAVWLQSSAKRAECGSLPSYDKLNPCVSLRAVAEIYGEHIRLWVQLPLTFDWFTVCRMWYLLVPRSANKRTCDTNALCAHCYKLWRLAQRNPFQGIQYA